MPVCLSALMPKRLHVPPALLPLNPLQASLMLMPSCAASPWCCATSSRLFLRPPAAARLAPARAPAAPTAASRLLLPLRQAPMAATCRLPWLPPRWRSWPPARRVLAWPRPPAAAGPPSQPCCCRQSLRMAGEGGWLLLRAGGLLGLPMVAPVCTCTDAPGAAAFPSLLRCSSAADAAQAMDALCPPDAPLLHLATASRSAALLQARGRRGWRLLLLCGSAMASPGRPVWQGLARWRFVAESPLPPPSPACRFWPPWAASRGTPGQLTPRLAPPPSRRCTLWLQRGTAPC